MLVLTRKTGESFLLGEDITVTVVSVEGDKVRIGIEAPMSVRIFRRELLEETIQTNRQALQVRQISFK